jgi:hypothetical protein
MLDPGNVIDASGTAILTVDAAFPRGSEARRFSVRGVRAVEAVVPGVMVSRPHLIAPTVGKYVVPNSRSQDLVDHPLGRVLDGCASIDLLGGVNEIGLPGIRPLADGLATRSGC